MGGHALTIRHINLSTVIVTVAVRSVTGGALIPIVVVGIIIISITVIVRGQGSVALWLLLLLLHLIPVIIHTVIVYRVSVAEIKLWAFLGIVVLSSVRVKDQHIPTVVSGGRGSLVLLVVAALITHGTIPVASCEDTSNANLVLSIWTLISVQDLIVKPKITSSRAIREDHLPVVVILQWQWLRDVQNDSIAVLEGFWELQRIVRDLVG